MIRAGQGRQWLKLGNVEGGFRLGASENGVGFYWPAAGLGPRRGRSRPKQWKGKREKKDLFYFYKVSK
uniref:Uncharacterized protein n=1 Tax=Arundo donax TaxID=35708 RepID=A0A0A9ETH2_ARUDO